MSLAVAHLAARPPPPRWNALRRGERRGARAVASLHKTHGQWWNETPGQAAGDVLDILLSDLGSRRALTAALELSVEACIQKYDDAGRVESLERWLTMHLGENLRSSDDGGSFTPAGVLRKVLRDSLLDGRVDDDAVAAALADELKRRFTSRRATLREQRVCVTWRGKSTNLSTMSRATTMDVSVALALPDEDFAVVLAAVAAGGDGTRAPGDGVTTPDANADAGAFLANTAWTSRGSHLP